MKIASAALAANLQNPQTAYLLLSDEPALLAEDRDLVRAKLAHDERKLFVVDRDFDAAEAEQEASAAGLFGGVALLEFIVADPLSADTAKLLTKIAQLAQADARPVLAAGPPPARAAAWLTGLEKHFTMVTADKVQRRNMVGWVAARAKRRGLILDPDAAQFVADMTEGNLSSAVQEIDKLKILHGDDGPVSAQQVRQLLADQSRDDLFSLREALAAGSQRRAARAVRNLKAAKEAPTLVVWALAEETRALLALINKGRRPRGVFGKHLADLADAARRISAADARRLLAAIGRADWAAKGMTAQDPWLDFERIAAAFTQLVRQNKHKFLLQQHEYKLRIRTS